MITKMCRIQINQDIAIDEAWEELERADITVAYSETDSGLQWLHVFTPSAISLQKFDWVEKSEYYNLPEIDWESQWELHGMNFKEGLVHVDLSQFGSYKTILKLKPGPGFGDLSHPTTLLVLKLMPKYLKHQNVVDIGCGSGILTLAAVAMGSKMAYGVDIEIPALTHSLENAQINHLEEMCRFLLPTDFVKSEGTRDDLILMNMILSEQNVAWQSMPSLHHISTKIITSGILQQERALYLEQTSQWGWELIDEIENAGWLGFCFQLRP